MGMASEESAPELSYRERDVDDTLDEHDRRISNLEKAAFVGAGYVVGSEAPSLGQLIEVIIALV